MLLGFENSHVFGFNLKKIWSRGDILVSDCHRVFAAFFLPLKEVTFRLSRHSS